MLLTLQEYQIEKTDHIWVEDVLADTESNTNQHDDKVDDIIKLSKAWTNEIPDGFVLIRTGMLRLIAYISGPNDLHLYCLDLPTTNLTPSKIMVGMMWQFPWIYASASNSIKRIDSPYMLLVLQQHQNLNKAGQ